VRGGTIVDLMKPLLIPRSELLGRIGSQPQQHWLVEAGGGFGKTVLASQLRSHVADGFAVLWSGTEIGSAHDLVTALAAAFTGTQFGSTAELIANAGESSADIAAAIAKAGPVVVVIDGTAQWSDDAQTFLSELVTQSHDATRFVILGRLFGDALRSLGERPSVSALSSDDLAFTDEEVAALIDARGLQLGGAAEVLAEATAGWPVAVHVLFERLVAAPDPSNELGIIGATSEPASAVLERYLGELDVADQAMMATLASLPTFDPDLVTATGRPGLIDRLVASGVPVSHRFDGRWEFCGPVRDLVLTHTNAPPVNEALVQHLLQRRDIRMALDYCLGAGALELAAEVIASLQIRDDILLDVPTINRAMTLIGHVAESVPRSLLVQARTNLTSMHFDVGIRALEAAHALFEKIDSEMGDPDHHETAMDLALQYAFMQRLDETTDLIERYAPAIGAEPSIARAIMLEARSISMMRDHSTAARREAEASLTEAIGLWRQLDEPRGAMSATLNLVSNVLLSQARYRDALEVLDAASQLRPVSIMNRARLAVHRGMILPFLGRLVDARAELDRAVTLANSIGHGWLEGWAWWKIASLHAIEGEAEAMAEAIARGRQVAGELLHHPGWSALNAEATEDWLRSGHPQARAQALTHVRDMEKHSDASQWKPEYARWLVEARTGSAPQAISDAPSLLARSEVPRDRRWLIELYLAVAHQRTGDLSGAQLWRAKAESSAVGLGTGSLIELLERSLIEQLTEKIDPDPDHDADPDAASSRPGPIELRLFGRFEVHVNAHALAVPGGHVSTLIKLLALAQNPVHTEALIDRMWPDDSVAVGRKRLRNILLRARKAGVSFVERDGDLIVLTSAVDSDLSRARAAAKSALADNASTALASVEHALSMLTADLLPEDRYADWAEDARNDLRTLTIALHDRRAAVAVDIDEVDVAVAALQSAAALDPLPNDRNRRSAQLLREAGRPGAAAQLDGLN